MNRSLRLVAMTILLIGFIATGCHTEEQQSTLSERAEKIAAAVSEDDQALTDQRIAKNAMPVTEVVAKLQAGVSKEELLAEVQRRRIPSKIVDIHELELAANGAGHKLLAAMKDPANVLTAEQEAIYIERVMQRQAEAASKKKASR